MRKSVAGQQVFAVLGELSKVEQARTLYLEQIQKGCDILTVKEYLSQLQDLEKQIDDQKEYIETLRESLTSIGGMGLSPDKVQTSGADKDKIANVIAKVLDADDKLKDMEKCFGLLKVQIAEQIHMMDDLTLKKLLKLRYIDWKEHDTIKKVADALGYSYDYTKELHRNALEAFERMFLHLTP